MEANEDRTGQREQRGPDGGAPRVRGLRGRCFAVAHHLPPMLIVPLSSGFAKAFVAPTSAAAVTASRSMAEPPALITALRAARSPAICAAVLCAARVPFAMKSRMPSCPPVTLIGPVCSVSVRPGCRRR